MRFIQYRGIKRGNKKEKQYNQEKFGDCGVSCEGENNREIPWS